LKIVLLDEAQELAELVRLGLSSDRLQVEYLCDSNGYLIVFVLDGQMVSDDISDIFGLETLGTKEPRKGTREILVDERVPTSRLELAHRCRGRRSA
jgi:hypothetical protein